MINSPPNKLLKTAFALSIITIIYNVLEGIVSLYFGAGDETLSLSGFGADSFVEVFSGIGIFHLLIRIKLNGNEKRDKFEKTALRITGASFYILAIMLALGAIIGIITGHKPDTTLPGIIIASVSLLTMRLLMHFKMKTGTVLNSQAILADAACTKTCLYLSAILLISSLGFQLFHIGYLDSIGAAAIALYSFKEGKESFEKARSENFSCGCEC